VSDLVATNATTSAGRNDAHAMEEVQHPVVSKLQQKVLQLSAELRDVRRELGGQRDVPSQVRAGAYRSDIGSLITERA
jgi:hypothetical protein